MGKPLQLTYLNPTDSSYSDVVLNRYKTVIRHPRTEFLQGETFSFVLNTTSFVDLRSIKLNAEVNIQNREPARASDYLIPFLFSEITLKTTSGVIIEHLDQAQTVGYLHNLTQRKYTDNETQSSNSINVTGRYNEFRSLKQTTAGTAYSMEIPAYELLGFFNVSKILRLSTMGGLLIDFKLASMQDVLQMNGDTHYFQNILRTDSTPSFSLKRVKTVYDEVETTDSFMQDYNDNVERKGFTIEFVSSVISRSFVNNLQGQKTIPINRSVQRCKSILSIARTIRPLQAPGTPSPGIITSYTDFLCPLQDDFRYQYKISGDFYPRVPVTTFQDAYNEYKNVVDGDITRRQQSNLSFRNFSTLRTLFTDYETSVESIQFFRKDGTLIDPTDPDTDPAATKAYYVKLTLEGNITHGSQNSIGWGYLNDVVYFLKVSSGAKFRGIISADDALTVYYDTVVYANDTTFEDQDTLLLYSAIDEENEANDGSFMMCTSLNNIHTLTSKSTHPVEASQAFLEFNFNSDYATRADNYNLVKTSNSGLICVDTFLIHYVTMTVRDGEIFVSK